MLRSNVFPQDLLGIGGEVAESAIKFMADFIDIAFAVLGLGALRVP